MKKALAIELNGGLLREGDGDTFSRLQPEAIFWLNKILREIECETFLISNEVVANDFLNALSSQGIAFTRLVTSAAEIDAKGFEIITIDAASINNNVTSANAKNISGWELVYRKLKGGPREVDHHRKTNETDIRIKLNLDGIGSARIDTGLHFFDHMLEQIGRHGSIDLDIMAKGDLHIDEHHTIEDTAIALGEAFAEALGDKRGIERYGFCLPMDDALAQVAIDFGGRAWLVWEASFTREKIGDMPTEMFYHFFKSFSDAARCNINIKVEGSNEHHKIEAIFKAFARAIKMAVRRDYDNMQLPSTKGVL